MWELTLKKHMTLIVLIGLLLIPFYASADDLKTSWGTIQNTQQKTIEYWQEDESTKTIIVFDDLHREKYRISTESGRVFCGVHEKIEELDLERDGG